ncbi:hypothetical protein [Duganella levis]|uniref:Uncharacterized protein n=1 Tax=Duganella levis TaxID=2692169 RepID=A0ABW9W4K3_9BURK|nr:hypothetical protein [Duganella levis]MYN28589.1 hypothetical protein [Duganella levis]
MNSKFIALIAAAGFSFAATAQTTTPGQTGQTATGTATRPTTMQPAGTQNPNALPLNPSRSTLSNPPNTLNTPTTPNSNLNSNNLNSPNSNLNSNNLNNSNLSNTNRNGSTVNCGSATSSATTGAPPLTTSSRVDTAPSVACNNSTQPGQVRP